MLTRDGTKQHTSTTLLEDEPSRGDTYEAEGQGVGWRRSVLQEEPPAAGPQTVAILGKGRKEGRQRPHSFTSTTILINENSPSLPHYLPTTIPGSIWQPRSLDTD